MTSGQQKAVLYTKAPIGILGIKDIKVKNYRDTGYLGGKLKGYDIFRKEIQARIANIKFVFFKMFFFIVFICF